MQYAHHERGSEYPVYYRSHVTALVLDQDTDDEKLFLLGGYNYHWGIDATDQADEYDETTKTFRFSLLMQRL